MITIERTMSADALRRLDDPGVLLFQGESNAHTFLTHPAPGVTFSGTITSRFIRADGSQVAWNGSITGGDSVVVLPAECYNVPGVCELYIYDVVDEDTTVCVYACRSQVVNTVSGKTVDDEDVIITIPTADDVAYSGEYTPAGTVSQPTFTGTRSTHQLTLTPSGTVSQPTFTGTQGNVSVSGTPAGSVSQPTFTGNQMTMTASLTPTGSVSAGSGTPNYTPAGSVSAPTVNVTPYTDTIYEAGSGTGGGSVTPGAAASCTLPGLSMSVTGEKLIVNFTPGSFTPNTPTQVTLPSFTPKTVATGIQSATASQPTFTGTGTRLTFSGEQSSVTLTGTPSGTVSQPTFTGSQMTASGTFTPSGTVSQPTFVGTEQTASLEITPSGTVSAPTFSGTPATIRVTKEE